MFVLTLSAHITIEKGKIIELIKSKRMPIIEISSLSHPGVEIFSTLTEAQLRNRIDSDRGIFIAESPKVIQVALDAGYEPLAILCEQKHIIGDAAVIIERCGDIPVYTGKRDILALLTGYTLTRGVLCAMRRPELRSVEEVCREAKRIVVIDGVVDTTNIGAIFRSAAALGIDAVLLTRNSCDESVFDVLQRTCRQKKLHMEYSDTPIYHSAYIEGIANLYEFDAGQRSGWMYRVNGWFPNYGCSRYQLQDGDVVEWVYTCELGNDVGGGYAAEGNE